MDMTVALYDAGDLPWRPVSTRLVRVRRLTAVAIATPLLIAFAAATLATSWFWIGAAVVAVTLIWAWWFIGRQVAAISYAELPEELVIRRGRIFRSLVSIPYGRLQYADMASGPLSRRYGIASVTIHTASPSSSGSLPGLELPEAEALRERLTALGEAQRAGL